MTIVAVHEPMPKNAQREQSKQNPIAGNVGVVFKEQQKTGDSCKKAEN